MKGWREWGGADGITKAGRETAKGRKGGGKRRKGNRGKVRGGNERKRGGRGR